MHAHLPRPKFRLVAAWSDFIGARNFSHVSYGEGKRQIVAFDAHIRSPHYVNDAAMTSLKV